MPNAIVSFRLAQYSDFCNSAAHKPHPRLKTLISGNNIVLKIGPLLSNTQFAHCLALRAYSLS